MKTSIAVGPTTTYHYAAPRSRARGQDNNYSESRGDLGPSSLVRRTNDPLADAKAVLAEYRRSQIDQLCAGTRSVAKRRARAHACEIVSAFLIRLFSFAHARPDAAERLGRLDDRQLLARSGTTLAEPADELERVIIELSDLLVLLKDPCHGSVWKHRRFGIPRRPGSGMPLFPRPLTWDRDTTGVQERDLVQWLTIADRDALEWVEDPFTETTFTSESRETYRILAPAVDACGDVPMRRFSRWRGLSRATEFRLTERKRQRGATRVVKKDPAIVGLYERDGRMVVNLETYVLDLVDRRDPAITLVAPAPSDSTGLTAGPTAEPQFTVPPERITPAEEEMEHFLAAAEEHLREEFRARIENERAAGLFIDPAMRVGACAVARTKGRG